MHKLIKKEKLKSFFQGGDDKIVDRKVYLKSLFQKYERIKGK
jgi:hypothetical protein